MGGLVRDIAGGLEPLIQGSESQDCSSVILERGAE